MPQEVFDQDRPPRRSAMAQRLDDAFAGCEEWTIAPPSPRRADALDIAPWMDRAPKSLDIEGRRLPRAA
jgi:hypothetical protein